MTERPRDAYGKVLRLGVGDTESADVGVGRGVEQPPSHLVEYVLPGKRVLSAELGSGLELENHWPVVVEQLDDDEIGVEGLRGPHRETALGAARLGRADPTGGVIGPPAARGLAPYAADDFPSADQQARVATVAAADEFLNERALATKPVLAAELLETLLERQSVVASHYVVTHAAEARFHNDPGG